MGILEREVLVTGNEICPNCKVEYDGTLRTDLVNYCYCTHCHHVWLWDYATRRNKFIENMRATWDKPSTVQGINGTPSCDR